MRKEKELKTQQARFLKVFFQKYGTYRLSRKLKFNRTTFNSWYRITGRVPLEKLGEVSRALNINKFLLNYEQMASLEGCVPDTWKNLVKSQKFSKEEFDYIFEGTPPGTK